MIYFKVNKSDSVEIKVEDEGAIKVQTVIKEAIYRVIYLGLLEDETITTEKEINERFMEYVELIASFYVMLDIEKLDDLYDKGKEDGNIDLNLKSLMEEMFGVLQFGLNKPEELDDKDKEALDSLMNTIVDAFSDAINEMDEDERNEIYDEVMDLLDKEEGIEMSYHSEMDREEDFDLEIDDDDDDDLII